MIRVAREGKTEFFAPIEESSRPLFYNPHMRLNRDISLLFISSSNVKNPCDLLSATGIRAFRIYKELGVKSYANDLSRVAFKVMKMTKERFGYDVDISNCEANLFLLKNRGMFDYIDIDPFGSPVNFISSCMLSIGSKGYIGVTATDTATLCGVYPKCALRRYGSYVAKTDIYPEVGLRNLAGYIIREAAKYDLSASPELCYAERHYYRVYIRVEKGRRKADHSLEDIGYAWICNNCLSRGVGREETCPNCKGSLTTIGPLYTGKLFDRTKIKEMMRNCNFPDTKIFIENIAREEHIPLYYELSSFGRRLKISIPKRDVVINALKDAGFRASMTYMGCSGIRTDAPAYVLSEILKSGSS